MWFEVTDRDPLRRIVHITVTVEARDEISSGPNETLTVNDGYSQSFTENAVIERLCEWITDAADTADIDQLWGVESVAKSWPC